MVDAGMAWFARPGHKLVAIGGCGRSGTTLASTMLSSHSRIHLHSEGGFENESNALRGSASDIDSAIQRLMERDPPTTTKTHWCEKTPRNIHRVRGLLDCFGDSVRFVNVVRDGRDVVTSKHPMLPNRYWVAPRRWVRDVAAGRTFEGKARFLTVRYEDLVMDPEKTLRRICVFVELPFEDVLLRYPDTASVRKSGAWFGEDAKPLHAESIGRWQQARHREVVLELLRLPRAVELLAFYGYPVV